MSRRKFGVIKGFLGPKGSGKTYSGTKALGSGRGIICDVGDEFPPSGRDVACWTEAQVIAAIQGKARRVIWKGPATTEAVEFLARVAKAWKRCFLFLNEAETYLHNRARLGEHMGDVLRRGRHVQVDLFWTAQRPQEVLPVFRQNSDERYFFAGSENTYLKYVRESVQKDLVEKWLKSPKYTALYVPMTGQQRLIPPKK